VGTRALAAMPLNAAHQVKRSRQPAARQGAGREGPCYGVSDGAGEAPGAPARNEREANPKAKRFPIKTS